MSWKSHTPVDDIDCFCLFVIHFHSPRLIPNNAFYYWEETLMKVPDVRLPPSNYYLLALHHITLIHSFHYSSLDGSLAT